MRRSLLFGEQINMTVSDTLIILATLFSPLIAVQTQKWIERATVRRNAQRQIFYSLMATRATRIAPQHVEALNRIDLEFNTSAGQREREVVNRWRIYADHLNRVVDGANEAAATQWNVKAEELFLDLLEALSYALRYGFDRVQLRRGIYYPRAHSEAELRKEIVEREVIRLLTGQSSLNMRVTDLPHSEEDVERLRNLYDQILEALSGDGALRTKSV